MSQDGPRRAMINGVGAVVTASATVIFLVSKFLEGAWVVVVAVPLLIVLFNRVEAYYSRAAEELATGVIPPQPERKRTLVVVPVTNVSRLTQHVLSEAIIARGRGHGRDGRVRRRTGGRTRD